MVVVEKPLILDQQKPRAKDRIPGGSSSGSAAAVSADLCDMALGSDTGEVLGTLLHIAELLDLSQVMELLADMASVIWQ